MEETKGSAKKLMFSLTTCGGRLRAKFSSDTDCLVRTERLADISTKWLLKTQQDITQPQGEGKGIHFEPQNANFRNTQVDSAVWRDMFTTTTATSNSRQRSTSKNPAVTGRKCTAFVHVSSSSLTLSRPPHPSSSHLCGLLETPTCLSGFGPSVFPPPQAGRLAYIHSMGRKIINYMSQLMAVPCLAHDQVKSCESSRLGSSKYIIYYWRAISGKRLQLSWIKTHILCLQRDVCI